MTADAGPLLGKHLLLVDDEPALLVPMRRYFERLGAAVTVAQRRDEGVALLGEDGFDLVVVDLLLGDHERDGIEVLHAARRRDRPIPVIVLSGLVTPDVEAEVSSLGAGAVLPKPQTLRELARVAGLLMGTTPET
jgi:DNA-binding response OmpR family regulator